MFRAIISIVALFAASAVTSGDTILESRGRFLTMRTVHVERCPEFPPLATKGDKGDKGDTGEIGPVGPTGAEPSDERLSALITKLVVNLFPTIEIIDRQTGQVIVKSENSDGTIRIPMQRFKLFGGR